MARRKLSHLETRGRTFWIRITVPKDLRLRLRRREWRFSLKTREPTIAKLRCLKTALAIERVQVVARQMPQLSNDDIVRLARSYMDWALSHAAETAATLPKGREVLEEVEFSPRLNAMSITYEPDANFVDGEIAKIKAASQEAHKRAVSRQYDMATKFFANELLREAGFTDVAPDSVEMDQLMHLISRARAEQERILHAQLTGDYENTVIKDPVFRDMAIPPRAIWHEPKSATAPPTIVHRLHDLSERYIEEKTASGEWKRKTVLDNKRVARWLQALVAADTPIDKITKADIRNFKDALNHIPKNFEKLSRYAGMTLPQIIEAVRDKPQEARLSIAARAKYFSKLKAFLTWCENEYDVPSPGRGIVVAEPDDQQDRRDPFSHAQLQALFQSPLYKGHGKRRHKPGKYITRDGMFWSPLICLFQGMRLGEVAQLCLEDVKQIDGIWCLDNNRQVQPNDGPPKQFKTKTSVRLSPIHPKLLAIGFLDYVDARRGATGSNRVFPDIKAGRKGDWSNNISKNLNRYLAYTKIKTPKTAVHSLRHNFADACEHAPNVSHMTKKALLGHRDDSVTAIYGSKPSAKPLFDGISQIEFGLDLNHLIPPTVGSAGKP